MPSSVPFSNPPRFDVREIPCAEKFGRILARWHALQPGEAFVLVNSHDPLPLFYQFNTQFSGEFEWRYQTRGPEVYEILIGRLPEPVDAQDNLGSSEGQSGRPEACDTAVDVDTRGLEPPEPMMRILQHVKTLRVGQTLVALTERMPVHLVEELHARGLDCRSEERSDGSWVSSIRLP